MTFGAGGLHRAARPNLDQLFFNQEPWKELRSRTQRRARGGESRESRQHRPMIDKMRSVSLENTFATSVARHHSMTANL